MQSRFLGTSLPTRLAFMLAGAFSYALFLAYGQDSLLDTSASTAARAAQQLDNPAVFHELAERRQWAERYIFTFPLVVAVMSMLVLAPELAELEQLLLRQARRTMFT